MDDNKRPTEDETLLEGPQPRERPGTRSRSSSPIPGACSASWGSSSGGSTTSPMFGMGSRSSARPAPNPIDPHYKAAVETARLLAQAGIPVITGGGPGIMEAANRVRMEARGSRSAAISSCPSSRAPTPI